jgi:hypothetical protein
MFPDWLQLIVKPLSVIAGAALGWLGVGVLIRRVGKWVIFREVPRAFARPFQLLGALAAGLWAWAILLSPGGPGPFWGSGWSVVGGPGHQGAPERVAEAPAHPRADTHRTALPRRETPLRITVLGGPRVVEGRFYLLEGDQQPKTLAELQKLIRAKQLDGGLREIDLLIYENSVARNHPAVRDLESWAERNSLTVTKPPTRGEIP